MSDPLKFRFFKEPSIFNGSLHRRIFGDVYAIHHVDEFGERVDDDDSKGTRWPYARTTLCKFLCERGLNAKVYDDTYRWDMESESKKFKKRGGVTVRIRTKEDEATLYMLNHNILLVDREPKETMPTLKI
jgi:hypothetical protein